MLNELGHRNKFTLCVFSVFIWILVLLVLVYSPGDQTIFTVKTTPESIPEGSYGNRENNDLLRPEEVLQFLRGKPVVAMDNPKLLQHIHSKAIAPSAGPLQAFNPERTDYSQVNQSTFIDQFLNGKRNGFYMECGAARGEDRSNSLFFEKERGWSGLLIEADPNLFHSLLSRRRRAYHLNACLSPTNNTVAMDYRLNEERGGLGVYNDGPGAELSNGSSINWPAQQIQCYPVYSVFLALGITHIDYFSLDVEGAELDILHTMPVGAVTIDTFTIEFRTFTPKGLSFDASKQKLEAIREFFKGTGLYEEVGVLPPATKDYPSAAALDVVFARKDLQRVPT